MFILKYYFANNYFYIIDTLNKQNQFMLYILFYCVCCEELKNKMSINTKQVIIKYLYCFIRYQYSLDYIEKKSKCR